MKKKNNYESIRVNVNLPKKLVDRVKEFADNLGVNYTTAYIMILNQNLDQSLYRQRLYLIKQFISERLILENNFSINKEDCFKIIKMIDEML